MLERSTTGDEQRSFAVGHTRVMLPASCYLPVPSTATIRTLGMMTFCASLPAPAAPQAIRHQSLAEWQRKHKERPCRSERTKGDLNEPKSEVIKAIMLEDSPCLLHGLQCTHQG